MVGYGFWFVVFCKSKILEFVRRHQVARARSEDDHEKGDEGSGMGLNILIHTTSEIFLCHQSTFLIVCAFDSAKTAKIVRYDWLTLSYNEHVRMRWSCRRSGFEGYITIMAVHACQ